MEAYKFCEDCKFAVMVESGVSYTRCSSPLAERIGEALVSRVLLPYASNERLGYCNREGKNWEARETKEAI
jgi:hypothetical protein